MHIISIIKMGFNTIKCIQMDKVTELSY